MKNTTITIQFPTALKPDLDALAAEAEIPVPNFVSQCAQVFVASRRMAALPVPPVPEPPEPIEVEDF